MPTYIVEAYGIAGAVVAQRERAELVARLGTGIRYVRTTIVPSDQMLLHVFEAASAGDLGVAVVGAALDCDRIVEVVEAPCSGRRTRDGRVIPCRPRAGERGFER